MAAEPGRPEIPDLDAFAVPIAVIDRAHVVVQLNGAFTEAFGWSPAEVLGRDLTHIGLDWPTDAAPQLRTSAGELRDLEISPRDVGDRTTLVMHDVTASRQREHEFEAVLGGAYDGFLLVSSEGFIEAPNPAYCEMTGYTPLELSRMHAWDLDAIHDREACLAQGGALLRNQRHRFETVHRRKDGTLIDVEISMMMLPRQERKVFTFIRDITDRKRALAELQHRIALQEQYSVVAASLVESESRLQAMADTVGEVFWMVDAESGRILFASAAMEKVWGVTVEALQASPEAWLQHILPDDLPLLQASWERGRRGLPSVTDYRVVKPDGSIRWLRDCAYPRVDADGKVSVICGVASDVTDQRQADEQLRKLWRAVEQSHSLILITDERARIEYVNPRFTAVLGYTREELIGQDGSMLRAEGIDQAPFELVRREMRAGRDWNGDLHYGTRDGRRVVLQATMSPILDEHGAVTHFLGVYEDVTERRDLEARLQQSQKMEALGLLAGGVAHDFNNLLLIIGGYAEFLSREGLPEPLLEMVGEIQAAAHRAASLTRQLLAFSRLQASAPQRLDLDERVTATLSMLRRLLPESIALRHTCSPHPLPVLADPGQLDQVLLNLAVNARDAMPRGGLLQIQVSRVDLPPSSPHAGKWARLRFSDDGCGISSEVLPRIFEPFFTTKEMGQGTGLGLATVHGIVEQHHGWIEVESPPSGGAEFRVHIPLLDEALPAQGREQEAVARGRGERILLVEDERHVRDLVRRMLVRLGYEVVAADDGAEALVVWQAEGGRFDLVVTDVIMPGGLSGHEVGRRLRDLGATVPVLYLSGYSPEVDHLHEDVDFLPKPCTAEQLGIKIREMLERPPQG